MREFLRARWTNLALFTYDINPSLLAQATPPGCDLDLLGGRAFVSLVAFDFLDTAVLGIRWPGYRNFPEINLRFYVRCQGRRGVCFIREFVPKRFISAAARLIYNEPYRAAPMTSHVTESAETLAIEHRLLFAGSHNTLRLVAGKPAFRPARTSIEHFFKEHEWGFGTNKRGQLQSYAVHHPPWDIYPIQSHELHWNWTSVYGSQWSFLQDRKPISIILAAGSAVTVHPVTASNTLATS